MLIAKNIFYFLSASEELYAAALCARSFELPESNEAEFLFSHCSTPICCNDVIQFDFVFNGKAASGERERDTKRN